MTLTLAEGTSHYPQKQATHKRSCGLGTGRNRTPVKITCPSSHMRTSLAYDPLQAGIQGPGLVMPRRNTGWPGWSLLAKDDVLA